MWKEYKKKGECAKFIPPWKGPGYITEILGPNKVKVDMNGYIAEVHVDNILSRYCNDENSYKNIVEKKLINRNHPNLIQAIG